MTLSPVQQAITAHIHAQSEHSRLFLLEDWKLATNEAVCEAITLMDNALVALCALRPQTDEDRALRIQYLDDRLVRSIDGDPDLSQRVIVALLDTEALS